MKSTQSLLQSRLTAQAVTSLGFTDSRRSTPKHGQDQISGFQSRSFSTARLQGTWAGTAFGAGVPDFFKMTLRRAGGNRLTGRAESRNSSDLSLFGITSLQGRVVDGALLLKQTGVIQANLPPGSFPCLRSGRLKISVVSGKPRLSGNWLSTNSGCGASQIRLQKQ